MCKKVVPLISFALVLSLVGTKVAVGDVWEGSITSSTDDREHYVGGALESATSSDLEMPYEGTGQGSPQVVGLRFVNVAVPSGATITSAYIEFVCDETKGGSEYVSLIIEGQKSPDTVTFNDTVIGRPRTDARVVWVPPNWTAEGQVGRTSDIFPVIEEIIQKHAGQPAPADGATVEGTAVNLSWTQGWASGNSMVIIISDNPDDPSLGLRCAESWDGSAADAALLHIEFTPGESTEVTHDVYFGNNSDDVNDGVGDTFLGNQTNEFLAVGCPRCLYPDGLAPGTTYYWRVDNVEADGTTHKGSVWSFTIPPRTAYNPNPSDGSKYAATDSTLSWTAGLDAKVHTVYFSDDFDTVNDATGGTPQVNATYDPGPLAKGTTYYWRVDAFDGRDTHKGDVWSFTTMPVMSITDPNLIGWWKFDEGSGTTASDFSGHGNDGTFGGNPQWVEGIMGGALALDGSDYVAIDSVVDDITSTNITISAWIRTTQTGEGNVFACNDSASAHPFMFGVLNGNPFVNDGGDTEFPPAVNDDQWHMLTYVRDGPTGYIYVDGVQQGTYFAAFALDTVTRWSIGQEWDGSTPSDLYTGAVDDARFYNAALTPEQVLELTRGDPLLAWDPNPSDGAIVDVERAKQPLSWSSGDNAAQHDVYFGLDKTAVENAVSSDTKGIYRGRQAGTTYAPPESLEWGTGPYYWRIDEYNTDGTTCEGGIWSFTVADHLIVDDFESYTDDDLAGNAVWQSWIDGFGIADNGAQVGYLLPPYCEQTIVHGGAQSMPFFYDNTAGVRNSEAELTLTAPRDWTAHGVGELSLWFRGNPASVGSFTEGPAGTYTMTASGTDIWDTADEFHFAYKTLSGPGSIVARIDSIQNTNDWAKAGVMIRETLDPGSRHAFACITPANGIASQARIDTDGTSMSTNQTGITAPYWVKLERDAGGNFSVSHSANGTTWQPVQGAMSNRVVMSVNVYIGLALTSHDAALTCEAVFSNVATTGTVSGQWAHQDIGVASNAAEPLYVAVSNITGAPVVVAHEDAAAATIDTWAEWVIPLQAFVDQGINLADVDKIAIGLGSKGNATAAGGSGTIYFDDIGLYRPRNVAGQ